MSFASVWPTHSAQTTPANSYLTARNFLAVFTLHSDYGIITIEAITYGEEKKEKNQN